MTLNDLAQRLGEQCFKDGFRYWKAGVLLEGLIDENSTQQDLFNEPETPRQKALMVVAHHLVLSIPDTLRGSLHYVEVSRISGGGARFAVILFFVLSGFVLALPYFSGKSQVYSAYFVRRFFRLYPPFAFAVLISALLSHLVGGASLLPFVSDWANQPWSIAATSTVIASHLLLTGMHWDDAIGLDTPIWSLIIEMRVSIIFPLLVMFIRRFGWAGLAAGLLGAFLCAHQRAAFGETSLMVAESVTGALLLTVRYIFFFLLGIMAAAKLHLLKGVGQISPKRQMALFICLVFVGGALSYRNLIPHGSVDVLYALIAIYLITACVAFPKFSAHLSGRLFLWLGDISYSLYLIHLPVLLAVFYFLHGRLPLGLMVVIALPVMLIAGHIMHYWIERAVNDNWPKAGGPYPSALDSSSW